MLPFGLKIIVNNYVQQVFSHNETVRFAAHPFIKWLAKFLPITPYVEAEYPRYKDADPLMIGDALYVSPAQYKTLKERTN